MTKKKCSILITNFSFHIFESELFLFQDIEEWKENWKNRHSIGEGDFDKIFNYIILRFGHRLNDKIYRCISGNVLDSLEILELARKQEAGIQQFKTEEFIKLRLIDGYAPTAIMFIKIDCHIEIDDPISKTENFIDFNLEVSHHMVKVNDLYSMKKEGDFNYVRVIMKNDNCDETIAIEKIVKEIKHSDDRINQIGNELKKTNDDRIVNYVVNMIKMVKGNLYWHGIAKRYK